MLPVSVNEIVWFAKGQKKAELAANWPDYRGC